MQDFAVAVTALLVLMLLLLRLLALHALLLLQLLLAAFSYTGNTAAAFVARATGRSPAGAPLLRASAPGGTRVPQHNTITTKPRGPSCATVQHHQAQIACQYHH